MKFSDFTLHPSIIEGLIGMGFEEPTPIQEQVIPSILEHKDLIGCAQTGTGKTAAFLLPVLDRIVRINESDQAFDGIKAMIITPTRELALQIDQQLQGLAYFLPVSSIPVYGGGTGTGWEVESRALREGADIVIGTPGKIIAHLNQQHGDFSRMQTLVLDEADRMLDMGFSQDIMRITSHLPKERQTLLFSATMPPKIRTMAQQLLVNPTEVSLGLSKPAEGVLQAAYMVYDKDKNQLVHALIANHDLPSILIFCSTKVNVKKLNEVLNHQGIPSESVHSDLDQSQREETLLRFRNKQLQVLVATDVLSRGIDIKDISLVINYDVPNDAEDYVHRVGRTARAATDGLAITFCNDKDQYKFSRIEELIGYPVRKLPLPAGVPEGPEYDPSKHRERPYKRNSGGSGKSGGKSPREGNKKRYNNNRPASKNPPKKS